MFEQRFKEFAGLGKNFHDQIEVRYTSIAYNTNRQSIMYNDEGPFWACDFRKLLSHDPKEPPCCLGTIYLQKDLIDHIKENFEAAWEKSIEWNEV